MYKNSLQLAGAVLALAMLLGVPALAGWDDCQPLVADQYGTNARAVSDGNGGAVILQHFSEYGAPDVLKVQRVSAQDEIVYTVTFSDSDVMAQFTAMAPDGNGGAYILFFAGGDTKVKAIHGDGTSGPIRTLASGGGSAYQTQLEIRNDHNGGAWAVYRVPSAQGGNAQDAVLSHLTSNGYEDLTRIVYANAGGLMSAWDFDMAVTPAGIVYVAVEAQDLSGMGYDHVEVRAFNLAGLTLLSSQVTDQGATSDQYNPVVTCLADGSAAVLFYQNGSVSGLYGQRLLADGYDRYWSPNGHLIRAFSEGSPGGADVVGDGLGGAVVAYRFNGATEQGIRAHRLSAAGQEQWQDGSGMTGVMVSSLYQFPLLQHHGAGGAVVICDDYQSGLYAEAVDAAGNQMWPDEDHVLCEGFPTGVAGVFSDGNNGAMVVASFGGWIKGARVPWALLDTTGHEDYDIIPRSTSTSFRPTGDSNYEAGFNWKTYGVTPAEFDQVTFSGILQNPYNCWLTAGESLTLTQASVGTTVRVMPTPDGATLHQILWLRKHCQQPCHYAGTVTSGDGMNTSDPARVKLMITQCPQEYEEPIDPKRGLVFEGAKPNPFNPSTRLQFTIPEGAAQVTLRIYNLRGELVREFAPSRLVEGPNTLVWQGDDRDGARVPSGVYFARLTVDGQSVTRKLALLK